MVEIARALLSEPGIIIFDEPTSSLTSREKARLFDVIHGLKADGVTIIYITHFLDEVFQDLLIGRPCFAAARPSVPARWAS